MNYGWQDDWIAKPAPGAIEVDATGATLEIQIDNAIGEHYTFEVGPETTREQAARQYTVATDNPLVGHKQHGRYMNMHFEFRMPND